MSENNVSLGETTQDAVPDNKEQPGQVEQAVQGETEQNSATDTSDDGSDSSTTSDDSGETQAKPKRGFEKRISKVVSERDRARQELDYWRDQALKQQNTQPTAPQDQAGQYAGKPLRDQYESDDQYLEALSDFKIEQRLSQRELQQQQAKLVENYNSRAQEFAKERPDYFEIIDDAADLIIAPETAFIIQKSEIGPKIALHLAENPDVADKLNRFDATTRLYELGKLEMQLSGITKKAAPAKRVSNAPAPLNPVKGSAPAAPKDLYDPQLTTAEWIALRQKRK
jgi:hypothetical protein